MVSSKQHHLYSHSSSGELYRLSSLRLLEEQSRREESPHRRRLSPPVEGPVATLAAFGVWVNAINPGMVKTPLNRAVWEAWNARQPEGAQQDYESWTAEKIQRMVPLNRWQEPEDVAAMAAFLASERARNVTGQAINVDGGFVMHT